MSKNALKKIIIKKRHPSMNADNKKALLNSNAENNYMINEKIKKNPIINYRNTKNELHYSLENKENCFSQFNQTKENSQVLEINCYLNKAKQKNRNNNLYNIKNYENLSKLANFKNENDSIKIKYSKLSKNDNKNYNLNNQSKDNNNNKEINIYNKKLAKSINSYKIKEGFLTSRLIEYINNQQHSQKMNNHSILVNKPLTERDNIKNLNTYQKNNYFLPDNNSGKKTLILDLDETLIHSSLKPFNIKDEITIKINSSKDKNKYDNNTNYIIYLLKRPYLDIFLSIICDIFEVIVFTAGVPDYANSILDKIDTEKKIKYRLFRDHCIKINKDKYIKNLFCLGRDLKNVIIIDNNPISYTLNIDNGLPISTWESNPTDNELIKLIPLLQYLSKYIISDVRPIIKKIVKSNIIDYEEVNKLIISSKVKESIIKRKQNDNGIKIINQKNPKFDNSLCQKLELISKNNNKYNNLNYKERSLKNIFVNKYHDLFIKELKSINKTHYLENSDISRNINSKEFKENGQQENNSLKRRNYNYSQKYILFRTDHSEPNYQKNGKTDINNIINNNYKNKEKINKSLNENSNKENSSIPLPPNNSFIIPIYKNSFKNKNKIYSKNHNKINLSKYSLKKDLNKNYSDYGLNNIKNNEGNEQNSNFIKNKKYNKISLKKLIYNNKSNSCRNISFDYSKNDSINKSKLIVKEGKAPKQILLNFKRNDKNIRECKEKHNYSVVNYLNNKFNLQMLNNTLINFIKNKPSKCQTNFIKDIKNNYFKINNKSIKKNNSLKNKSFNNNLETKTFLKDSYYEKIIDLNHSFSFLNNKHKSKDNLNIIKGYKFKTNK